MPIVTITSDWNKNDWYLPKLKGSIYSYFHDLQAKEGVLLADGDQAGAHPGRCEITVTDITHSVRPFDVAEACFILRNCYRDFPEGTIHLLAVDSEPSPEKPMAIVSSAGRYVVGINDGRFSLLFDKLPPLGFKLLPPDGFSTFAALEQFTEAVGIIMENTFGDKTVPCTLAGAGMERPVVMEDRILGRVIYIDSYGNAVTNISREIFAKHYTARTDSSQEKPDFVIYVSGPYLKFRSVSRVYSDVPCGSELALFNSLGLLEIAVNNGNFSRVENIDTTAEVMIKFTA